MTEQDVFNFAVNQNPELKKYNMRDVVDFVYNQNPEIKKIIEENNKPVINGEQEFNKRIVMTPEGYPQYLPTSQEAPKILNTALTAGSFYIPGTLGVKGAKAIAGMAGIGAGLGATQSALEQMGEGKEVEGGEVAKSAAIGGGLFALPNSMTALSNTIKRNVFIRRSISKILGSSTGNKQSWATIAKATDEKLGGLIGEYDTKTKNLIKSTQKAAISEQQVVGDDAIKILEDI